MSNAINYFSLDTVFDDKIKLIEALYGLSGFAIIIKLWQKIYSTNGYFAEWCEDYEIMFANETKTSQDTVHKIIEKCFMHDIFSKEMYNSYNILTSAGIQKRFVQAAKRKREIELTKEYLLIDIQPASERQKIIYKSLGNPRVTHGLPTGNQNKEINKEINKYINKQQQDPEVVVVENTGMYFKVYKQENEAAENQLIKYLDVMDEELILHVLSLAKIDQRPWRWITKVLDTHYAQKTKTVAEFEKKTDVYNAEKKKTATNKFCDYEQTGNYDIEKLERRALEKRIARIKESSVKETDTPK